MKDLFFDQIKNLVKNDDGPEVPRESLRRAIALFPQQEIKRPVFSLRRLVLADMSLRKAGISKTMVYEFDETSFVQLMVKESEAGFSLEGVFNGFNPEKVMFYSDSQDIPVDCKDGVFSISFMESGDYDVMFEEGGRRFWVRNVEIEKP